MVGVEGRRSGGSSSRAGPIAIWSVLKPEVAGTGA